VGAHALDRWYLGPALEHDQCYKSWIWDTSSACICDTVSWFPTYLKMPIAFTNNMILASQHIPTTHAPTTTTNKNCKTIRTYHTSEGDNHQKRRRTKSHNPDAPLRVPIVEDNYPEAKNNQPEPLIVPKAQQKTSAAATTTLPQTFSNSTGPTAQRKRRNNKSNRNNPARATIIHTGTRTNRKIQLSPHLACILAHYALHGNAMNLDTDQIAKYLELSQATSK